MNALRNKVQLIGRLGNKVEVKRLDGGKCVANASLATNDVYKNQKGERVEETTWHNLVIWGKTAEILEKYTDKGSEIAIEGKLTNETYDDKDGIKRYVTKVKVNELLLLGDPKSKATTAEADLPF